MISILSSTALRIFSNDGLLHLFRADEQALVLLRRRIERPDLHRTDATLQQTFGHRVGAIHKAVEVFIGTI
jgi:hypothetical protein